jgi:hypothetical protein
VRTIESHIANPVNDKLVISAVDEPGAGGANHLYEISGFDVHTNSSQLPDGAPIEGLYLTFQNGPIKEHGVNGITQEALLAIVADRLQSFQKGPFACEENENALRHVEAALAILQERTKARMARGVEGTSER